MVEIKELVEKLKDLPRVWDGKKCILELKENGDKNWKQMEWIGWYFEYWCKKNLGMNEGTKFGHSQFDGNYKGIDFDFKAHPIRNKLGKEDGRLITNDTEGTMKSIEFNGETRLIVVMGECDFDKDGSFKKWNDKLKGKTSLYEKIRIKGGRPSRMRKTTFRVRQVNFYSLNKDTLKHYIKFQKGMRNSDGSPRREKIMLDLTVEDPIYVLKLNP